MKIIITGGAGFIGKHLTDFLLNANHEITILDNFSNSTKKSINSLIKRGVNIIEGDITNSECVSKAFKNQEIVIHLAAKISVDESIRNPLDTFHVNVEGTKNVLVASIENNIKKLIVASSSAVYGEAQQDIKLDESSKINPISPYGKSKAVMEDEVRRLSREKNLNCIILRFFNIFGNGQSPEYAGVITKFLERISQNKSLKIFGDGNQTRDFVSIKDVVNSIYCSIIFGKSGTYNIASGKTVTINELAEKMISWSGKNLQIEHMNRKKGDIKHSQADISLAELEIKYFPKFGLDEIRKMI